MTMTLVSTVTVGSGGAASIDFNSVPQSGTDLLLVFSVSENRTSQGWPDKIVFNGNVGSVYSWKGIETQPTSIYNRNQTGTSSLQLSKHAGISSWANSFNSASYYIPNYTASTNKSISAEYVEGLNMEASYLGMFAGLFSSTSPITSIQIFPWSETIAQYSTASLYVIQKGSGGASVS